MKNYVLIVVGALSLFLSEAALAQQSGTEQERRACPAMFRGIVVR